MGKFYQCTQSSGPSFMTKFCSALYLENLLTIKFVWRGIMHACSAFILVKFGHENINYFGHLSSDLRKVVVSTGDSNLAMPSLGDACSRKVLLGNLPFGNLHVET